MPAFALLPAHLSQLDDHGDHCHDDDDDDDDDDVDDDDDDDDDNDEDVHLSKAFYFQVFCSLQ